MKYNDVIDRLQNLTMSKINTTELAEIIGVPVRTLYTNIHNNSARFNHFLISGFLMLDKYNDTIYYNI